MTLASRYGLFTASIPRLPAPGQVARADVLAPELAEIWEREIFALRTCSEIWDTIAAGKESGARERLGRKLSEH